jgi:alkanesulfonate monooxygenase SsuD/methylene tetrahydromethanopterin reductase-like flavin-dependent oxidoreductase (luciferase family)
VLVLAGQSGAGIELAARYAEMAFSGPPSLEAAVALRTDLHAQAAALGRDPDQVLVLPALMVTLGGTEASAQGRARKLEELTSPEFRWQNALYTAGLDPDAFDPGAPLPAHLWAGQSPSTRADQLYAAARARPEASLREVAQQVSGGAGQRHFIGTPEQLADYVIAWQDAGAIDGFTIMGSTLPYELAAFVDHVVPILQRRGRYRDEYTGTHAARSPWAAAAVQVKPVPADPQPACPRHPGRLAGVGLVSSQRAATGAAFFCRISSACRR